MSHVPFVSSYHKIPVDECDLPVHPEHQHLQHQEQQQQQQQHRLHLEPEQSQHCHSTEWSQLLCCCTRQKAPDSMPSTSQHDKGSARHPEWTLPDDVVKKIRQVDQQTSTLTSAGVSGLSARVLDKSEYRLEQRGALKGSDIVVVQLVEIIKKPGQSLGLYLREGNGLDRQTGVFASRFGENSELAKFGDVLHPGDEILSVNNVDVSSMSIDDVVLVLSIPRRLLLRTRFFKNQRERLPQSQSTLARPVVVFHKDVEEKSENADDASTSTLLSHPTSTANTWLGKKARKQQQEMIKHCPQPSCSTAMPPSAMSTIRRPQPPVRTVKLFDNKSDTKLQCPRTPVFTPSDFKTSDSFKRSPNPMQPYQNYCYSLTRNRPLQRPAVVGMEPRIFGATSTVSPQVYPTSTYDPADVSNYSVPYRSDVTDTSIKLQPRSMSDVAGYTSTIHRAPYASTSERLRPVTSRGLSGWEPPTSFSYKSNSLPRRRAVPDPLQRTVKWRNDVTGGLNYTPGAESDGATSAPENLLSPTLTRPYLSRRGPRPSSSGQGRTIDDIFSAQEYRHWADFILPPQERQSRWSHAYGERQGASARSSSLPSRTILSNVSRLSVGHEKGDLLDQLHVSPLMNRRVPLRPAGPGFDVDTLNVKSLTGLLVIQVIEGRNLKLPLRQKAFTEEMYCVLEVNEVHRARTGVSTAGQRYQWKETFQIDVQHATHIHFFVYSWHPQYRHKLCHKGCLKLLEAFIGDRWNGNRMFALHLEPKGQLIVRITFHGMSTVFKRAVNTRFNGLFGVPLQRLITRDGRETPIILSRLLQEIEDRGTDYSGLYILSGSEEKKRVLRSELENNVEAADLSVDVVPDTNVLACLVKDFLRELPEPLIPMSIYSMLVDAFSVSLPNDPQGNQQLLLRIIDCLPTPNKKTLIQVMDHLRGIIQSDSHNGIAGSRLTSIFGCLIFCSCDMRVEQPSSSSSYQKQTINPLDPDQATRTLGMLLDNWPPRGGSDSSGGSDSVEANAPNPVSESQC